MKTDITQHTSAPVKQPLVSVIVPCYNEEETIHQLLDALLQQSYPLHALEVIVADGMSTDNTRHEIEKYVAAHPELRVYVVDNPARNIPAALNRAIARAKGEIILRLDAHSYPHREYIERCVRALQEKKGDNVGGVWDIVPGRDTWQGRAIALAASHPLGVGDARYRFSDQPAWVDTVPFGAFYRRTFDRIGLFDETLLTNEDYEFNTRLRQSGGRIWMDPSIRATYFARASFKELARQYWRYGYWKVKMLRRYPATIRWRQALPPLFVFSLLVLALASIVFPIARWAFVLELATYAIVLLTTGLIISLKKRDVRMLIGVPLAIATMHLSWGSAFLRSLFAK